MKYINPKIPSSYQIYNTGKIFYDLVLQNKPTKIIEFGTLFGYSAVCMAMALDELGRGEIICYDLWEDYPFKHSTKKETQDFIDYYGLAKYIKLRNMDLMNWEVEAFDLLHIDISNDGTVIEHVYNQCKEQLNQGKIMLFEGGSQDRDRVHWMLEYNKVPINSIKSKIPYTLLSTDYPSLSIIGGTQK